MKWNKLQNWMIALLLVSTICLTYSIWSYTMGTSGLGLLYRALGVERQESVQYAGYEELSYALRVLTPLRCAVRASEGAGLYGTTDRETASVCFEKVGSLLAEALETAQAPEAIRDEEWRDALSGTMFFLDFGGQVPLSSLAQLLGVQTPESLPAQVRYLTLNVRGGSDGAVLYYMDADRKLWRCGTDAEAAYLTALVTEWTANGFRFAYEEALTDAAEPLLLAPSDTVPALEVSNALSTGAEADFDRIMEGVLESLGFNAYRPGVYSESDGTKVYVEEERTLRVAGNGRMMYFDPVSANLAGGEPDAVEKTARIAEAAHMVSEIMTAYLGDAELFLLDTGYDAERQQFTVRFGVECGGVRILTERGYAAALSFKESTLCAAELELRTYRRTGTNSAVIPASQALAAASRVEGLGLYYRADGNTVKSGWFIEE